jgi:hypothetical protein
MSTKDGTIHFFHWEIPQYKLAIDFFPKGNRGMYRTSSPKIILYYEDKEIAQNAVAHLKVASGAKHVRWD